MKDFIIGFVVGVILTGIIMYINQPNIEQERKQMKEEYEKGKKNYVDSVLNRYRNIDSARAYVLRPN